MKPTQTKSPRGPIKPGKRNPHPLSKQLNIIYTACLILNFQNANLLTIQQEIRMSG